MIVTKSGKYLRLMTVGLFRVRLAWFDVVPNCSVYPSPTCWYTQDSPEFDDRWEARRWIRSHRKLDTDYYREAA